MKKSSPLYNAITGFVMGIAEVIPGVSGGTIAFVAGIYEYLLEVVNEVRNGLLSLRKDGFRALLLRIDWLFVLSLMTGMGIGVVVGVLAVTHLLENYPPVIWSFFFGLILASIIYMGRKVNWHLMSWLLFLAGASTAYFVTTLSSGGGSTELYFVFISGMIAITALVLPGISGSFMLLILGMYTFIVRDTLKGLLVDFSSDKLLVLTVFGLGCCAGLFSAARLLQWAFLKYRQPTIAVLTGFMLGSLGKIWPWRNPTLWLDKTTGEMVDVVVSGREYKVINEALVAPADYLLDPHLAMSIASIVLGSMLILLFARLEKSE